MDTSGLPHAIAVTPAEVTARAGAVEALARHKDALTGVENVWADGGSLGEACGKGVKDVLGATVEIAKRTERRTLAVISQRGVVERSFAWLEKCRRLGKHCERTLNTRLPMVVRAFLALLLKRS